MRRLVIRRHADADALEAFAYLVEHASLDTALRFEERLGEAYRFVTENPTACPHYSHADVTLRYLPVGGFEDYLVLFELRDAEAVRVVRVLHGRRDIGRILSEEDDLT